MKYFFDTEFIENGKTIDLLSIGLVADDGRQLYEETHLDANLNLASAWVREHVFSKLTWKPEDSTSRTALAAQLRLFCDPAKYGKPEFWAYYADYDWVVLCQLFGRMVDLPDGWPMYCNDFKQWLVEAEQDSVHGIPELEKLADSESHNALTDALWLQREFRRLRVERA